LQKNYRYDYFIFTRKVKAGVDAVQVLILGVECCSVDYQEFSWKYINQIIEALADHAQ
jgi:uroporphyrinogen decarboxylase